MLLGPLGFAALAGCRPGAEAIATARVDTLPSGTLVVTSDRPVGWGDSSRAWRVVETLRIQPPEGSPGELVEPLHVAADAAGRIYVADQKPAVVKQFDANGGFIRTIGREGAGPGEFRVPFIALHGAALVVHDPQQGRTAVFDTAGKFLRSWVSSCCVWSDIAVDTAGLAYIPTMPGSDSARQRGLAYTRYRLDGTAVDTLYVPDRGDDGGVWRFTSGSGRNRVRMTMQIPFAPEMLFALHPAGGFVRGWSAEYRIVRSPRGEDSTLVLTRPWTPEPISDALRQEGIERVVAHAKAVVGEAAARQAARLADVPGQAPAFQMLRVDLDGYVWVRRFAPADSAWTRYDVFAPGGAWLGAVTVPVAMPGWGHQFFGRGAIYAAIEGEDGRPAVVRLEVRR
ncbi:MAG TPA: 6-bladed beta-propeller [Gemmatimonadales bacterium]|nr:6-bladed beta-propeller [Gemmatimonadales bacterium]